MYNIIDQHKRNQSARSNEIMLTLNDTKSSPVLTTTSDGQKIDCAKVCPCGVPVIPVPDQWLEVMVTGGFKVWHIIFIIIAFVISIIVVYCCFHRCRIPRTKQEIEADLMRTNLTQKFGDYLQEFPNEPTTFLEAVKKVQELEEKWANERDDSGAKKRLGWLKLRGKERQTEKGSADPNATGVKEDNTAEPIPPAGDKQESATDIDDSINKTKKKEADLNASSILQSATDQQSGEDNKTKPSSSRKDSTSKKESKSKEVTLTTSKEKTDPSFNPTEATHIKAHRVKVDKELERQTTKHRVDSGLSGPNGSKLIQTSEPDANNPTPSHNQKPKMRRKRDKPNLSRTKATHVVGSHNESLEVSSNVLTLPVASGHRRSHESHHHHQHHDQQQQAESQQVSVPSTTSGEKATTTTKRETRSGKLQRPPNRTKKQTDTRGDSTFIQIHTDDLSPS